MTVALTGCAVAEAQDPPPAADDSAAQVPQGFDSDCLVGLWALDTTDYLAQATVFLQKTVEVPLDSLDLEGGQTLRFADDGLFDIRTDFHWSGTILGNPFSVDDGSIGAGTWAPVDENPGLLTFPDFAFIVPPGEGAAGAPDLPFPDPMVEGQVAPDCSGDDLVLTSTEGVLIGRFIRQ